MKKGIIVPPKQNGLKEQTIRDISPFTDEMFLAIQRFILNCPNVLIGQIKEAIPRGWRVLCLFFALEGEERHNCQEALRLFNKEFGTTYRKKAFQELIEMSLCFLEFKEVDFSDEIKRKINKIKEALKMEMEKEKKDILPPFMFDFLFYLFNLLKEQADEDKKDEKEYLFKGRAADPLREFVSSLKNIELSRIDARRIWDAIRQNERRQGNPILISSGKKGGDGIYTLRNPELYAIKGEKETPLITALLNGKEYPGKKLRPLAKKKQEPKKEQQLDFLSMAHRELSFLEKELKKEEENISKLNEEVRIAQEQASIFKNKMEAIQEMLKSFE